jgi:hypothetical protein
MRESLPISKLKSSNGATVQFTLAPKPQLDAKQKASGTFDLSGKTH